MFHVKHTGAYSYYVRCPLPQNKKGITNDTEHAKKDGAPEKICAAKLFGERRRSEMRERRLLPQDKSKAAANDM